MGDQRARLDPAALAALPVTERIRLLRDSMSAVSGRVGADTPASTATTRMTSAEPLASPAGARDALRVPGALGELLPGGGIAHGSLVTWPRGALLCGLLAAVTEQGVMTAVVGSDRLGLLAAHEMGARLDHIACIDAGPAQALDVLGVLADGIRCLVLDLPGEVPARPAQVQALLARIRAKGAVIVTTSNQWARQAHLGIAARHARPEGIGMGTGRVRQLRYEVQVSIRGRVHRRDQLSLSPAEGGRTRWSMDSPAAAAAPLRWARSG